MTRYSIPFSRPHRTGREAAEETGLHVHVADDPLTCVVRGSGRALEEMDKLGTVFTND